jgi:hypothetical protein
MLQINNGFDPVVPGDGMEKSVGLYIQASHNLSWDYVSHVDCAISGPDGFQLLDDVALSRYGPLDIDTAVFTGSFIMDFWYPAGVYDVQATAWEDGVTPGPLYTTSFNYAERSYVGTSEDSIDLGDASQPAYPGIVDTSATIQNNGNLPITVELSIDPFEDSDGYALGVETEAETPEGSVLLLGATPTT